MPAIIVIVISEEGKLNILLLLSVNLVLYN